MDEREWEQVAQRFLDDELSREERVVFLAQLGRDEPLRRRVVALEQLALDASELPRPIVPDGFVARVLNDAMPVRSAWQRVVDILRTPRTLEWNLGGAMVAAVLVLAVLGGGFFVAGPSRRADVGHVAAVGGAASSEAVLVRLIVLRPDARTVQVAGDFNEWTPSRTSLDPMPNGAWSVTLPLAPGRYEYMFLVDGQEWIVDPFAAELADDGFGSRNAVLDVRMPDGAL